MMEGNTDPHTPSTLKHDPRRQKASLPATLCLHTCLSVCQLCISHGVPEGPGSVPTHSNTEALWVGMRRWLSGQGPVWVSQHCRAKTCLDFYHKAPQAPQSMSPEIAVPLSLWDLGIWERENGGVKQRCLGMRSKTNRCFRGYGWLLLHLTQHSIITLYLLSCSPWIKHILNMKSVFYGFLCLYLQFTKGSVSLLQIILANDAWECW